MNIFINTGIFKYNQRLNIENFWKSNKTAVHTSEFKTYLFRISFHIQDNDFELLLSNIIMIIRINLSKG